MKDMSAGMKVAVVIILITFLYLFAVTFWPMTRDGAEQAKTITPFLLGTVIGTLIGFYYGNKSKQQEQTPVDTAAVEAAQVKVKEVIETKIEAEKKEDANEKK